MCFLGDLIHLAVERKGNGRAEGSKARGIPQQDENMRVFMQCYIKVDVLLCGISFTP